MALPGFAQAPPAANPSFEVASIKTGAPGTRTQLAIQPGDRFAVNGVSLLLVIAAAYRVRDYQIIGAQGWMTKDLWNIEATTAPSTVDPPSTTPPYLNVTDMMRAIKGTCPDGNQHVACYTCHRGIPKPLMTAPLDDPGNSGIALLFLRSGV